MTYPRPLYPENSTVTWRLDGMTYKGVIVGHELRARMLTFVTVAWDGHRPGRFLEAELPPGMRVGPPVSAIERTQPMPKVRAGVRR